MMMMPSSSSSSSSSSATVRVEKATSEFLIGPDWTMNIDICDTINTNHWLAKDIVKALKKRLQHKNPKVQLLALTLLETMVKNCGDYVHSQIAERTILQDMIKIVKKKTDMHVRDKILALLDSWQEAFGGPGGKYPQYYWAYEELRRFGVEFPQRSSDSAPIFTPPVTHQTLRHAQPGYGMPSNSSTRLDEAMAADMESLSFSSINSMRYALDLLADMLQAVNPSDRMAVKDEVIVDLVDQCRANQKKLMQMLATTMDEELLGQGLELNDMLQSVLGKHDAIVSGAPLPIQVTNLNPRSADVRDSSVKPTDVSSPALKAVPSAPVVPMPRGQAEEEDEEEDDFAQLARRHSKTRSPTSLNTFTGTSGVISVNTSSNMSSTSASPAPALSNALVLADPPAPVRTTKEQDIIDLLSITLSTTPASLHTSQTPASPHTSQTPDDSTQNMHRSPVSTTTQGYPNTFQTYGGNQGQIAFNSYVVPWAQPQPQPQPKGPTQPLPQPETQHPQYSSGYPAPPWAATPGYYNSQNPIPTYPYAYPTPRTTATSQMQLQATSPLQHVNSFPARGSNGSAINGGPQVGSSPRTTGPAAGHKPFIPSYRLFEDLNVLGSADATFKKTSNTSPSLSETRLSGTNNQSMVGGRK
ncbi:unnamed protein product [Ilex paraguariensis]|uniref:Uncharacterized protein n=1 Tax=Ilex paraguariensis TaxID=185542 RepID=A0ABC8RHP7_9AQUA